MVLLTLERLTLDINTFNGCHSEEQVFDQKRLLDVNRELSQVLSLWPCGASRRRRVLDEPRILCRDIIMIQIRSFE